MEQAVLNIPKYIYHATPYENLTKILNTGIEARNDDGVYCTNGPIGAVAFLYIRGYRDIIVFKIDTDKLNKDLLFEGEDHNKSYFEYIQVFVYPELIKTTMLDVMETRRFKY